MEGGKCPKCKKVMPTDQLVSLEATLNLEPQRFPVPGRDAASYETQHLCCPCSPTTVIIYDRGDGTKVGVNGGEFVES